MREPRPSTDARDVAFLATAIGVVLLATPARALWARDEGPWWAPFAMWLVLIALGVWVARAGGPSER